MDDELDIAIVGMAGRFPGARTLEAFWRNLAAGTESIARFTERELADAGVPASHLADPAYVKAAPVLERPGDFDAAFFGYPPGEARTIDPQQRLLLELAHEALEHAGCDPERYAGRAGVFAGAALNTYFHDTGLSGRIAEDYIPTLIGNDKDFLATRIAYKLDLRGPAITVQSACSTSLVAVHLARQSLLSRETDLALAGAVSVRVPHRAGYFCDGGGVVSPDGRVRAFDAGANGTVFGSGGGVVVLKRLADALAEGDTIHAVIRGSAVNNDGARKAGYTAPSVASQADAVIEALANAGVDADTITYVEAHGSGTPVGDPIEVSALTRAFRASTRRSGYCAIGSVKTNIGHLDAAAAMAGLIKTVLALKHRLLPPSLHFDTPNPEIDFPATPFYVNTRLAHWASDGPRRAGVMSTGMGGTNAHVVLEEAPPAAAPAAARPPHLLVLSAKSAEALDAATARLRSFLEADDAPPVADVAHTLQAGRRAFAHRRYLVCADRADALAALGEPAAKRVVSGRAAETRRPVVLLLPGIGDHYAGMAHDLYQAWPRFRQEVDRCAEILRPHLGVDIRGALYPAGGNWRQARGGKGIDLRRMLGHDGAVPEDEETRALNRTLLAQPALFTVEYALARLWQSLGVVPDAIVGHSLGEYVAACLAGVLPLEDALALVAARAKLVDALPQGGMLAVTLPEDALRPLLPPALSISVINGPALCVVAGPPAAVAAFGETLAARGVICRPVQNGHAFHSRMLDPVAGALEAHARRIRFGAPAIPYISNVTGTWITREAAADPAYWGRHATRTARFSDALRELWRLRDPILLEAGPGRTLCVLAMQHPERRHGGEPLAVPSLRHAWERQSDVEFLWHAVGRLWLAGVRIDWQNDPGAAGRRKVPLPTYPFERQTHWLERGGASAPAPAAGAPALVPRDADPSRWLYVPSWKRDLPQSARIPRAAPGTASALTWLVFACADGPAPALVAGLRDAGQHVVTVAAAGAFEQSGPESFTLDPANRRHYELLVRALQANRLLPERIVHAFSLPAPAAARMEEAFDPAQERGFYSLLYLARALAAAAGGREMELTVLSSGAQEVSGAESLHPERSTVLAPCMVIRQEYPNIRTRSVDIDAAEARGEACAELLLAEVLEPDAHLYVAYRNAQRWIQAYEPVAARRGGSPFRDGGVYLITGGLGGIGTAVAEYLAERHRARLVLVGRSSLPARDAWDRWLADHPPQDPVAARIGAIRRIEALGGEVLYVGASAADAPALRGAVEQAVARFGTLHGAIHGAGIVGDAGYREIEASGRADCERHFEAKARGALALRDALEGRTLDFCLLMSSLASVLGGLGQAAYAAANLYLDAFARAQARASATPWLSVNWDVWRLPGREAIGGGLGATLRGMGMSAPEAMQAMETVLALRGARQLVVSTGDLGARIEQWLSLESLLARTAPATGAPAAPAPPAARAEPRDDTERTIALIWQEALGVAPVGVDDDFAQLGGHSLLAVKIVSELRKAFGIDLPVRALFDAPTVAALARCVRERILAEIDALSDEEAERLVSNA